MSDNIIVNKHKSIPWHMTPVDCQIIILDYIREYYEMEIVDLSDGTILIDGLCTDINRAAYYANKKPS